MALATRRDAVVGGVTALVVGGLTLVSGDRIPAGHIAVPAPAAGYQYRVTPVPAPSRQAPSPRLDSVTVETLDDGVDAPVTRAVMARDLGGGETDTIGADAAYVADALRACDAYAVERGVPAPRRPEWEAMAAALDAAGVEVPYP